MIGIEQSFYLLVIDKASGLILQLDIGNVDTVDPPYFGNRCSRAGSLTPYCFADKKMFRRIGQGIMRPDGSAIKPRIPAN